jgi:hypothetical protein
MSQQTLAVQAAPVGGELELRVGGCWPLIADQGELFDYTHLVVGLNAQVTAGYVQVGPYVEVVPVSVLGFRAELHTVNYFPAGFSGAGYFSRPSYQASTRTEDLTADEAGSAMGFNAVVVAWLQLEIELDASVSIFVWDEAALEHWSLGDGPYYYNARWDLMLQASDELLRNDAFVGAALQLTPALTIGLGPLSALRRVPAADYTAHQLGGALLFGWRPPSGALRSLETFIAAGGFLEHSFRRGPFGLLTLTAGWDLGAL